MHQIISLSLHLKVKCLVPSLSKHFAAGIIVLSNQKHNFYQDILPLSFERNHTYV